MSQSDIDIAYEEGTAVLTEELETQLRQNAKCFMDWLQRSNQSLSLFFCSKTTIQTLNREYRQVDAPTDVLSWSYGADQDLPDGTPWGELVFCRSIIDEQAAAYGWPPEVELMRLLAHGTVHLHGLEHDTPASEAKMMEMELDLLRLIGLETVYAR